MLAAVVGSSKSDMPPASGNPTQASSVWHTEWWQIRPRNLEKEVVNTHHCSWYLPNHLYIHKAYYHLVDDGDHHLRGSRILYTYDESERIRSHKKVTYEELSNRFQPIPTDIYIDRRIRYTRHTGHNWRPVTYNWNMADTRLQIDGHKCVIRNDMNDLRGLEIDRKSVV